MKMFLHNAGELRCGRTGGGCQRMDACCSKLRPTTRCQRQLPVTRAVLGWGDVFATRPEASSAVIALVSAQ